jgi:hypothetical protein
MESMKVRDQLDARVIRNASEGDSAEAHGKYHFVCRGPDGKIKWEGTIENVVTTAGKNALLDAALAGLGYSASGPFMGLISSVGYAGAPVAGDTMAAHSNWSEVDASSHFPTIAARLTSNGNWAAASAGAKAFTAALNFAIITNAGTIKGAFLVFGTGAVATLGSTAGVLLSAGLFSQGDKVVGIGDTVQVSYSFTLT